MHSKFKGKSARNGSSKELNVGKITNIKEFDVTKANITEKLIYSAQ